MDVQDEPSAEQSLAAELRSSALLLGMVVGITTATVALSHLAFRLFG